MDMFFSARKCIPFPTSHKLTFRSAPPVATNGSTGLHRTAFTSPSCASYQMHKRKKNTHLFLYYSNCDFIYKKNTLDCWPLTNFRCIRFGMPSLKKPAAFALPVKSLKLPVRSSSANPGTGLFDLRPAPSRAASSNSFRILSVRFLNKILPTLFV